MFKLGNYEINKGIFLAPMEDITDVSFRLICKELGADFVYTEFVNAEGLVRGSKKTYRKMHLLPEERPAGIQIYGGKLQSMLGAAAMAEEMNPDIIDINAGCWVKNVVGSGAGAALLKDPVLLQQIVSEVVKSVNLPVTVKTRIGWDQESIGIVDIARRLEDAGIKALTVHCRTRTQGHTGDPDWHWIEEVKNAVSIPVILNGGINEAKDVISAFARTPADAVMIARGAIGNPWIFAQAKKLMLGEEIEPVTAGLMIHNCLKHLKLAIELKEERRGVLEHRKFYTGYLKGLRYCSQIRNRMMTLNTYAEVEEVLLNYLNWLNTEQEDYLAGGAL